MRPDQSSDGVPRRRQVGRGQASASPRGGEPQGGRLGGESQGVGCLRQDVADRSAVNAEGATAGAQASAEDPEGETSEREARLVACSRSKTHARQAVVVQEMRTVGERLRSIRAKLLKRSLSSFLARRNPSTARP